MVILDVVLMKYTDWESPIGSRLLAGDGETLNYLSFPWGRAESTPVEAGFDRAKVLAKSKPSLENIFPVRDGTLT